MRRMRDGPDTRGGFLVAKVTLGRGHKAAIVHIEIAGGRVHSGTRQPFARVFRLACQCEYGGGRCVCRPSCRCFRPRIHNGARPGGERLRVVMATGQVQ